MPFINAKVSTPMTQAQKETIKSKLGNAISLIPGKSEEWLMVGFEDNYDLYYKGNKNGNTAFINVKIFGTATPESLNALTGSICNIFSTELNIPADRTYIVYDECDKWGWNHSNF